MNPTVVTLLIALGQLIIAGFVAYGAVHAFAARLDERVKALQKRVDDITEQFGSLRERVASCETSLREREPLTRRKSPISLTERGVTFLKTSGSEQFVDANFDELFEKIEKLAPKTAYDIQEDAKKVVTDLQQDDRLNHIKDFLFKDGSSMDDIITVMGIYLRDKVLRHKGWNVLDIDTQEPAIQGTPQNLKP